MIQIFPICDVFEEMQNIGVRYPAEVALSGLRSPESQIIVNGQNFETRGFNPEGDLIITSATSLEEDFQENALRLTNYLLSLDHRNSIIGVEGGGTIADFPQVLSREFGLDSRPQVVHIVSTLKDFLPAKGMQHGQFVSIHSDILQSTFPKPIFEVIWGERVWNYREKGLSHSQVKYIAGHEKAHCWTAASLLPRNPKEEEFYSTRILGKPLYETLGDILSGRYFGYLEDSLDTGNVLDFFEWDAESRIGCVD